VRNPTYIDRFRIVTFDSILVDDDDRRGTVGERTAIEEAERRRDKGAFENIFDGLFFVELGSLVHRAVVVVLDGNLGQLLLCRAVLVHVTLGV
jgi:hypothetical protein